MLPYKYRLNRVNSIRFRNVSTLNRRFFIEIEPLYPNNQILNEQTFRSSSSALCINPNFEMDDQDKSFLRSLNNISTFDILIKLRAEEDPSFKVDFHVDFSTLEFIARDLSQLREYDFEIVVFKFENCFFTTKALFYKLQETNLITLNVKEIRMPYFKKNEKEQMMPTLAFMIKFNQFMTNVQKLGNLKRENRFMAQTLLEKLSVLHQSDGNPRDKLDALRQRINEKRALLLFKQQESQRTSNIQRITRYSSEKASEQSYYVEVFKAFRGKMGEDQRAAGQNFLNADLCKIIHLQRQTKSLSELFTIFFSPEAMRLYSGIKCFSSNQPLRNKYLDSYKDEQKVSVALGQVVMVTIHLGTCLGVPAKHPMIYNGHRSVIITPKQEPLQLYISQKSDYKNIDTGIQLLESNLKRIYRALDRLKEIYHLNQEKQNQSLPSSIQFPNSLMVLLYKICEFQI